MKRLFLTSVTALAAMSFSSLSYACDMHGAGYGFSMSHANWQSYTPEVSTTDPALQTIESKSETLARMLTQKKEKPSFSNIASLAAMKAKSRLAVKAKAKAKAEPKTPAIEADKKPL